MVRARRLRAVPIWPVYTTLGIRARPTRPTRPEGAPGLVPSPAQPRLFVRPVGSTRYDSSLQLSSHYLSPYISLATTFLQPLHSLATTRSSLKSVRPRAPPPSPRVPIQILGVPIQVLRGTHSGPRGTRSWSRAYSRPRDAHLSPEDPHSTPSGAYPSPRDASQSSKRRPLVSREHQLKPQMMPSLGLQKLHVRAKVRQLAGYDAVGRGLKSNPPGLPFLPPKHRNIDTSGYFYHRDPTWCASTYTPLLGSRFQSSAHG
jgi:hypothetical protein